MLAVVGSALLVVIAFAICDWSGRTLSHHYQDRLEVAAIFAVGACILGGLALTRGVSDAGSTWPAVALGLAASSGLFAGYLRGGRAR